MAYTNNQLARLYSEGKTKGKSNRMFIDGNTVYSFGKHFPIAKRLNIDNKEVYLFNSDGYSNTTAKHKSAVRSYLNGNIISVNKDMIDYSSPLDDSENYYIDNLLKVTNLETEHKEKEIKTLKNKIKRARKEHKKEYHNNKIKDLKRELNLINKVIVPKIMAIKI